MPTPLPAVAPRQQSALPIAPAATLQESALLSPLLVEMEQRGAAYQLGQFAPPVTDMGNGTGQMGRRQHVAVDNGDTDTATDGFGFDPFLSRTSVSSR